MPRGLRKEQREISGKVVVVILSLKQQALEQRLHFLT